MQADPQVITFGCRLNAYESEVIRGHARAAGLFNTIIFNTCAVTGEAERQARQAIRRARREHPAAEIIVTGCAGKVSRDRFSAMPEVGRIVDNDRKMRFEAWLPAGAVGSEEAQEVAPHLVTGFEGLARAFVQVQNGCDHRCTFCIIPFGRGASRSVPLDAIVAQTRVLVGQGYREIVLTGVDITSYGADLAGTPRLGQIVKRLLASVPDLQRLRLSSLDPAEMDEDLWSLIADEARLMPHLHLSLQSGDDLVLKRMKRRHSREQALTACRRARALRPGIALGGDFIAGFPTEDEAMAQSTASFVREADLTFLHVFPYSSRPGTPAARMPPVPGPMIKERAAALRALGGEQTQRFLRSRIGRSESVLVEAVGVGRTAHFAETRLAPHHAVGSVVPFLPRGLDGNKLVDHV